MRIPQFGQTSGFGGGPPGPAGPPGANGTNGTNGTNGAGVATGGTTGQILKKNSNTSYDTGWEDFSDANLSTSDITTNNVSTSKHGFAPKSPNDATKYLDGTGNYSVPAGSGGLTFPLTIVQEGMFQSGGSNVTSFAVSFPQTAAASGNTMFMICACDGSSTVTIPTGWTLDFNQQQATYARLILCHKTTASDTGATWTVSSASSFAVIFFEVSGTHALDVSSHAGTANTNSLVLPAITPTANSVVFGFACFVANASEANNFALNPISGIWKQISFSAQAGAGSRAIAGFIGLTGASNVSTAPPNLNLPGVVLFGSGGVAYGTFSIL